MTKLYSYDVFDTLITRKVATPKGIFAVMQHHLQNDVVFQNLPEYLKQNFYSIRIKAEKFVRHYGTTSEEITLEGIYSFISITYSLDEATITKLVQLECEVEREYIVGIPEKIASLKNHLDNGDRVVLISDMYLPKDVLLHILEGIDDVFSRIPFYLSSELGVRKTTGNIYHYVQKTEGVKYSSWIHIGDNIIQDIIIPKRLGIKVKRVKIPELLEYEAKLLRDNESSVTVQTMIGHSRYLRIIHPTDEAILASCGFTLLYPYVSWVVYQAVSEGLSDLYFISRDGYVLKLLADTIIDAKDLPIKTHYIYGSRDAWRIPESFDDALKMYESHLTKHWTLPMFLDRIGLEYSVVLSYLPEKFRHVNRNLSSDEISELLLLIQSNEELSESVHNHWDVRRRQVLSYFKQEIDFNKESFGFVEMGGSGFTMDIVQNHISPIYSSPVPVFYLTITGNVEIVNRTNHHKKLCWNGFQESQLLLEAFCRAPHGRCIDYSYSHGKIVPVFESDGAEDSSIIENYLELFMILSDEFTKSGIYDTFTNEGYVIFNSCIDYLSKKPSKKIVAAVGDIPFEYDSGSGEIQTFAPRYSLFMFVRELFGYYRNRYFSLSTYPEYSLWRSGWMLRRVGDIVSMFRRHNIP